MSHLSSVVFGGIDGTSSGLTVAVASQMVAEPDHNG